MTQNQYQAQQLSNLLEAIQSKQVSGVLYLNAEIIPEKKSKSCVLVWKDGRIMYGGAKLPDTQSLVKMLEQKLNREWVSSAVAFAMRQMMPETSIREFLERLVAMQLFSWQQIETVVYHQLMLTLEQVLPYPGKFLFDSKTQFNFCRSSDLSQLMLDIAQRQEQWFNLKPLIPSMDAVPHLAENALETITEQNVRHHLQKWVDGQRSLVDIAEGLNKDPLSVAKYYMHWVQAGWVIMEDIRIAATQISLPTILTVDDSVVMQEMIKRALAGYCQVLVANNAVDALNLIYQENILLMLLDVTMPEIDGLELCRTIRSIPQFRDLPIVMVTARNVFFDKVKGKFVGSNEYLTKPFEAETLRQIVGKYLTIEINSDFDTNQFNLDLIASI